MNAATMGTPEILGVTLDADGVNVAVFSANATAIEFCLFEGNVELQRIVLPGRSGDIFHGHIAGITEGARYGLRAHGPWAPDQAHRFNPSKLLLDPYALELDRALQLHPSMFAAHDDGSLDDTDSAEAMSKAIVTRPVLAAPGFSLTPWSETVIYELHVRGFTLRHPEIPEPLRGTFAGLAHPASIAHLQALGITAVEILPPTAWIEERHLMERGIGNYWGYNPVGFLAPDPRLAPGGWAEVREAVAALAAAGIETIVDIVLNHTGEGDARGPTLSLRGIDNATYFRATSTEPHIDVNDTGCGNTVALDRPFPLRLAMDCLSAWAQLGGVHGFRYDLAPVLGRTERGFEPEAPLLQAIEQDPLLSRLKMIAEPWDIGWGGYQLGHFPKRWGEWNDRFRDDIRSFWRGDGGRLGPLATRLAGSADFFGAGRAPSRSVNFVSAHDGFALADLVAYEHKHNDANGEGNRDGTDDNFSWNNGVEGPTTDAAILAARLCDQRALLASVLLARGTPMLAAGSEFGQTQAGNNNPYAQDNKTTWLDWAGTDAGLLAWTRQLIAIRRDHPGFHDDRFLSGTGVRPDVAWLGLDGAALDPEHWNATPGDALVMMLSPPSQPARLCLVFNRGRSPVSLTLPTPDDALVWRLLADSAHGAGEARDLTDDAFEVPARAVLALAEIAPGTPRTPRPTDPDALRRLADAAGVAAQWWETHGTHHQVGDNTTRAVLKAMQLGCDTTGEARDSLERLMQSREFRPLPQALVQRTGETVTLPMTLAPGLSPRTEWLTVALEDGSLQRIRAGAADAKRQSVTAADGRQVQSWLVDLPTLPIGRHRVWREDAPDHACGITIAPRSCFLPDCLQDTGHRFGVSAQLYTLRTDSDQGIGDFSTLRALAQATRQAGGSILGLNPMHTLFAGQRERASPYQPSDRLFLDPIYLDLPEAGGATIDRSQRNVAYRAVWARKLAVLERMFAAAQAAPDPAFHGFVQEGGVRLHRFAVFEAIAELHSGQSWQAWPEALRHPGTAEVAEFTRDHPERILFHQYLQFLCDRQLAYAVTPFAEGGLEIGLIRDLAVGCAPDGAEAWALAEMVAHGVSIGAPPDPLAPGGQVWGLPPPNPLLMARNNYAEFASLLEANMRHAGGLRIDHALGLERLFWVPDGADGADGTYVRYPRADLLGQIALESHRAQALVIGEDLGTVPDGLGEALRADDILSYRVLLLEREGRGFKPKASYPTRAIACVSTHDLPTFAGWLTGADIDERVALGQRRPEDAAADHAEREAEIEALREAVGPGDITAAAHAYVAETDSDLVYIQADDLAGETQAVNLPGTDQERPNWRRRLTVPLDLLFETDTAKLIIEQMKARKAGALPLDPAKGGALGTHSFKVAS